LLACYRSKQSRHGPPPTTTQHFCFELVVCWKGIHVCVCVCVCVFSRFWFVLGGYDWMHAGENCSLRFTGGWFLCQSP
jgi:hypothetical protein